MSETHNSAAALAAEVIGYSTDAVRSDNFGPAASQDGRETRRANGFGGAGSVIPSCRTLSSALLMLSSFEVALICFLLVSS